MGCKSVNNEAKVWVYKEDGSIQCEAGKARALSEDEAILKEAGVKVFNSKKDTDGMMRIQMCGSPTGAINSFEITLSDLEKAIANGFIKKN